MAQVQSIVDELEIYKTELSHELSRILDYWIKYTIDEKNGGFVGRIDSEEHVVEGSPKGSVLNARILWSFSAAYNLDQNKDYLKYAERAYQYITNHFIDKEHGGVYWTVDYKGNPLDTKKQVYAIAFTIYALSEYYIASGNKEAKTLSVLFYHTLLKHSYDTVKTGYFEAFTHDWQPISDLRLSAKDANEKKTMNTHLHVMEAYTNLYRIWPDDGLKVQIITLINNFTDHIIDSETNHLVLFFDENWNRKSTTVSYGHDIEATWLLQEAAIVINDQPLIDKIKQLNIGITEATIKGLDTDGGLWYEYEPASNHLIKEKHWWPQAEAMIGFYNTWQITGDDNHLHLSKKNWEFVKGHILDTKNGEWVWGINDKGELMPDEDKVGLWKCPYHNSRACIEIISRISG
ncbi:mannobiose 2-epimerase [Mucilaginibacter mallensis]|uniref:Cellobiose 2-epimerase n=1 Tax=Mucilaginibacter mallensis TaxID=652787 RepID=A0A1H1QJQ8_MUCMA|nr:AGE family epimerase/isomerase [Mucilaginibacter mallensis]SDS23626.1 mannobiose 2-epimerase [Mucilaginibacter mallensis]